MSIFTPQSRSDSEHPPGSLALIGGRFEADNHRLYGALRERSAGKIAVLSMASGYPQEVGEETVEEFRDQGFYAELVPIFYENREQSAFDKHHIARLEAFGSVFFTGGDQSRIVDTLVQNDRETPALLAVRRLLDKGGLIAGSSAGAAVMSGPMILGGTSLNAISRGVDSSPEAVDDFDAFRLGRGLGFFQHGMVDQHFLARGRIGRLIYAAWSTEQSMAFGVDENSALIVSDERAEIIGETGVVFIDLRKATFSRTGQSAEGITLSYLDDGDEVNLRTGKPNAAADKRRIRPGKNAYRVPAPVRRNAFAGYGLHDLMLRLAESDPQSYTQDTADAFDPASANLVSVKLSRKPWKSRALRAVRKGEIRYSALNFELEFNCKQQDACPLANSNQVGRPKPGPDSRLVLLGNSPLHWQAADQQELLKELRAPVGLLATASGEPRAMAYRYANWLEQHGVQYEILPIGVNNIERASRDRKLLRRIDSMGSLLLTGGDQRRLTEALLHCAEATSVLHSVITAYERGVPLIAVAASASAMGAQMIAQGDSESALRYGSTEDAGGAGVVVERGIGLTDIGLIDQNFLARHRLGRLLVACDGQKIPLGFGICEGSGLIVHGDQQSLEAIGATGIMVASIKNGSELSSASPEKNQHLVLSVLRTGHTTTLAELGNLPKITTPDDSAAFGSTLVKFNKDLRRALRVRHSDLLADWQEIVMEY